MERIAVLFAPVLLTAACGGGGGGSSTSTSSPPTPGTAYLDPVVYSSAPTASLASAAEITASAKRTALIEGKSYAYTATAGHLTALSATGQPEASFFHVAYTLDAAAPATRPVTFFYNGGPGSSSVWLHLGSYGPKRVATDTPGGGGIQPYALVDNAESLLDVTDLVFVDAVGTGLSEAISPFMNRSFWGVDSDAASFRDFITRWLAANHRESSPRFLFGESYGTTRSAVLANLLETAGVSMNGVVLLSSALDYNSNCGVTDGPVNCAPLLPSYHAAAAYHHLAVPDPGADLDAGLAAARGVADQEWAPAIQSSFAPHAVAPVWLVVKVAGYAGLAEAALEPRFNLHPGDFQVQLLPGRVTGLYDARMVAAFAPLAATQPDPSTAYIGSSFGARIVDQLHEIGYTNPSTYAMTTNAVSAWDFRHDGRDLPDTLPDLGAALAHNPRLKVFSTGGYDDLVTPFHLAELDTARLAHAPIVHRYYAGGHMTYLDDNARRRQKSDLAQFIRGAL